MKAVLAAILIILALPSQIQAGEDPKPPAAPAPKEAWESFYVGGKKAGFVKVSSTADAKGSRVDYLLAVVKNDDKGSLTKFEQMARFQPGEKWDAYTLNTGDGNLLEVTFDGAKVHGRKGKESVEKEVPPDTRPSNLYHALVATLPFEAGKSVSFTRLNDATLDLDGKGRVTSVGWEDVKLGGQTIKLWRIEEFKDDKRLAAYYVDEQHRLRRTVFDNGREAVFAERQDEALADLPKEIVAMLQPAAPTAPSVPTATPAVPATTAAQAAPTSPAAPATPTVQAEGLSVDRRVYIAASPEKIWDALVAPDLTRDFHMAPLFKIELMPGGEIVFGTKDQRFIEGKVLSAEKGRKLCHSFAFTAAAVKAAEKDPPTRVSLEIVPAGTVSVLVLHHDGFPSKNASYMVAESAWDLALSRLKTLIETGKPMDMPQKQAPSAP